MSVALLDVNVLIALLDRRPGPAQPERGAAHPGPAALPEQSGAAGSAGTSIAPMIRHPQHQLWPAGELRSPPQLRGRDRRQRDPMADRWVMVNRERGGLIRPGPSPQLMAGRRHTGMAGRVAELALRRLSLIGVRWRRRGLHSAAKIPARLTAGPPPLARSCRCGGSSMTRPCWAPARRLALIRASRISR